LKEEKTVKFSHAFFLVTDQFALPLPARESLRPRLSFTFFSFFFAVHDTSARALRADRAPLSLS
jgi:hypothetical protein